MERALLVLGVMAITSVGFIVRQKASDTTALSNPPLGTVSNTSILSLNPPDTTNPGRKEVRDRLAQAKDGEDIGKNLESEAARSEKPYRIIDGKSFIVGRNSWVSTGVFTDVIFVDGKRMLPDEFNRTFKKNSIVAVGTVDDETAKEKYGVAQPVFEIFINTRPKSEGMHLTSAKGKEPIMKERKDGALLKDQEEENMKMIRLHNLQRQLVMQENRLVEPEQIIQRQLPEEMVQKQRDDMAEARSLFTEGEARVKEQNEIMAVVKPELSKDGLIREGEYYELLINSREMLIDGKKQPALIHQKYVELIRKKRNRAFDDQEQWSVKVSF